MAPYAGPTPKTCLIQSYIVDTLRLVLSVAGLRRDGTVCCE